MSTAAHLHWTWQALATKLLCHAHDHLAPKRMPDEHVGEKLLLPEECQDVLSC